MSMTSSLLSGMMDRSTMGITLAMLGIKTRYAAHTYSDLSNRCNAKRTYSGTTSMTISVSIFAPVLVHDAHTGIRVTPSSLGECLRSQAYMCFYVKRHLDYKPYMTPSYVVAREGEAVKEKEREREKEAALQKEVDDAIMAAMQ